MKKTPNQSSGIFAMLTNRPKIYKGQPTQIKIRT